MILTRFSIGIQLAIGFVIAIALMIGSALITTAQLHRIDATNQEVRLLSKIDVDVHRYLEALLNEETGMRAYVASSKVSLLGALKNGRRDEPVVTAELSAESASNSVMATNIATAVNDAKHVNEFFDRQIELVRSNRRLEAVAELGNGKKAFGAFRADLAATQGEIERQSNTATADYAAARTMQQMSMISSTVASAAIMIGFALFLGKTIARRLGRVTHGLRSDRGG